MIENYDEKVRLIVGDLLADPEADAPVKSFLTAYDPSKDRSTNRTVLSGSRFQVATLDACARFFKIATIDDNGARIYSNKPSLAMRIILEIETFFPTTCGQCNEEYCNKFNSPTSPKLRCYLCFQGSHSCDKTTVAADILYAIPTSLPHGTVWLCNLCLMQNNPMPSKRPKSGRNRFVSTSSVAVSAMVTPSGTPTRDKKLGVSVDELSKKLAEVQKQQQSVDSSAPSALQQENNTDSQSENAPKENDNLSLIHI